ncbi:gliding motility-associated C-terminal domain-containing protein [Myroides indicus]|nr:gliding motility-associated C-terminal domain-containing protein [Myroides indicus]
MKRSIYNDYSFLTTLLLLLGVQIMYAQNDIKQLVNQGKMYVSSGTLISTNFDFENKKDGIVFNNGFFHFFKNYQNNGLFTYTNTKKTGTTLFTGQSPQLIAGVNPSKHYNVVFNNASTQYPFELNSDMIINGTGDFTHGIVKINKDSGGQMFFGNGAISANTNDASYAEGIVEKEGNNAFTYPIGKSGYYRLAGISAPSNVADQYMGEYFLAPTNTDAHPHKNKTGIIELIDEREYWTIAPSKSTKESVIVTLSWDNHTTPQDLIAEPQNLHIVRWDAAQGLWVDEGGIVDESNNTVTTPLNVVGFGIFTLGTIKEKFLNPGDVVIYNGVTPNNDGMNDYLIIDNIQYFPNNHVSIYNRWGRKVYETKSYNSKGNVFNGYAEGVNVFGKGEPLPSGTYYYVVEYLYDRDGQNQWIKKVGYLHLENNN